MCGVSCAYVSLGLGSVFALFFSIFGYAFLPGVVDNFILNEIILNENTEALKRFQAIPFPLAFHVYIFNLSNPEEVASGGIPIVQEVGPFTYKCWRERLIESIEPEFLTYRSVDRYEFDDEASYPLREDDVVTIVNPLYHAVLQAAEIVAPPLLPIVNTAMAGIFGQYNDLAMTVSVGDLAFHGVKFCVNPGVISTVACAVIRQLAADVENIQELDGALEFSLLGYRTRPTPPYKVNRGLSDFREVGIISEFDNSPVLNAWPSVVVEDSQELSRPQCNMLNGTDTGIFSPFLNIHEWLYAFQPDICRSVSLRYIQDIERSGVQLAHYVTRDWFLDNHEGCFCVNATQGIRRENGCLLDGAMELYSCVGAPLVLTFPHFLFADPTYVNGVIGVTPDVEKHALYLDIETTTGVPFRGSKRAQFNVFSRPVPGITSTQNLSTVLVPLVWIDEAAALPDEYINLIRLGLMLPNTVFPIAIPVLIVLSSAIAVAGLVVVVKHRSKQGFETTTVF